jgi:hypothetical protein
MCRPAHAGRPHRRRFPCSDPQPHARQHQCRCKLALGFALVLLLTLPPHSGWQALDGAIVRSQQLSEINLINDLGKDLRAERITYRVLSDDTSKTRMLGIYDQLENLLTTLRIAAASMNTAVAGKA